MNNQKFFNAFQKHLLITGPKRVELLAEVRSHLDESPPERFGDPKQLAHKLNHVHLGFFSSFRRIVIPFSVTVLLFDVLAPAILWLYFARYLGTSSNPFLYIFSAITPYLSTILFLYFAHAVSRLRDRWIGIFILTAILGIGFAIHQAFMSTTGYLLVSDVNGAPAATLILQQVLQYFISYLSIGYAAMIITSGRQRILPRISLIDISLAGIIIGFGAYYLLPVVWSGITNYHYTMQMYLWSIPFFNHFKLICLGIGVLGGFSEWARILVVRRSQKNRQ